MPLITSGDYIFQQDNASIHVSTRAKLWFKAIIVYIYLVFRREAPILIQSKTYGGLLARKVYKNGTQYQWSQDLVVANKDAWKKNSVDTLKDFQDL